jgi:hypothetical protein
MSELVKYQGLSELSAIIQSDKLSIFQAYQKNPKIVVNFLTAFMIEFCSIYKIDDNKSLSDDEIKECVQILIYDYKSLKKEDFLLFQRRAKRGLYGNLFGYFDMPTFFNMLEQYCQSRVDEAVKINKVKIAEINKEPISEKTQKLLKETIEKLKSKKVIKQSNYQPTEEQKMHSNWRNEFYTLTKGDQFLDIEGKKYNVDEYLKYKFISSQN